MDQKKYWQSFAERTGSEELKKASQDEFKEELTIEDASGKGIMDAETPRRDFLKYLGFSTAAAALAASCEIPVRKAIPYVNKPENLIPGLPEYYATTYVSGGDAEPVIAKVRDGRPIKIEPNEQSRIMGGGGTSAHAQASVLDLYDTARLRFPMQKAGGDFKEVSKFEVIDKIIGDALTALGGAPIVLLTSTITSPSLLQAIEGLRGRFAGLRHVQYDGVSYSGMLTANETSYGKRALPTYAFENARTIVSLGADFLGTWLSPVEFRNGYTKARTINEAAPQMSKHYQFEGHMSMTGSNADERFTHAPSQTGAIALALLAAVGGGGQAPQLEPRLQAAVAKVAKDLQAGGGLVISGSNNPSVQVIVNAINDRIGANGTTINWAVTNNTRKGTDAEFDQLLRDMEGGAIGGLIVYDANPAYNYYDADRFKKALAKVRVSVSCSPTMDETTELCQYIIPSHHFLESWGDAEPRTGYFSLMQPTIAPLFKTRQFADTLLAWSGNAMKYDAYFKQYWTGRLGSEDNFYKALQDGFIEPATPATPAGGGFNAGTLAGAGQAIAAMPAGKTTLQVDKNNKTAQVELVLYQNVAMGDGRHPNNPWLLELPDPVTRACWDNYVMISPALAKELLDIDITNERQANDYEFFPEKHVLRVKAGNKQIELPSLIVAGMHPSTIAIAVGYGRSEKLGRATKGAGKNAFPLASFANGAVDFVVPNVTVEKAGGKYPVAQVQTHHQYEGRHEVVRELTLANLQQSPDQILKDRARELEPWGGLEKFYEYGTLYPVHGKPGIKWGMSIDMNACYGCGACVVACHVENNVPVVGKSEVMRSHDMHWLRIDRYYTGDPNNPDSIQTLFQPMLCQHCDNAPCENVCPVAATPHSSEGLNQMTYNRCIGTRYCANNCPYKVRRFNWADYLGSDSFEDNQNKSAHLDDAVLMMNDDLTRMVLNPDVTVRSRGVMEKCSFCVQRLQDGKLRAKKENRPLVTGNLDTNGAEQWDVKTACQQACAAGAITFGNVHDPNSAVSKHRQSNMKRLFYVLEPLHTLPNISYLPKIRNTALLSGAHEVAPKSDKLPASTGHSSEQH